jgi:hypothetical protein
MVARCSCRPRPARLNCAPLVRATVVWLVDTSTLQRVADVPLPEPAFDTAPSPDGSALLATTVVAPPD